MSALSVSQAALNPRVLLKRKNTPSESSVGSSCLAVQSHLPRTRIKNTPRNLFKPFSTSPRGYPKQPMISLTSAAIFLSIYLADPLRTLHGRVMCPRSTYARQSAEGCYELSVTMILLMLITLPAMLPVSLVLLHKTRLVINILLVGWNTSLLMRNNIRLVQKWMQVTVNAVPREKLHDVRPTRGTS